MLKLTFKECARQHVKWTKVRKYEHKYKHVLLYSVLLNSIQFLSLSFFVFALLHLMCFIFYDIYVTLPWTVLSILYYTLLYSIILLHFFLTLLTFSNPIYSILLLSNLILFCLMYSILLHCNVPYRNKLYNTCRWCEEEES